MPSDHFDMLKHTKSGKVYVQIVKDEDAFRWRAWDIDAQAKRFEEINRKPSKLAKATRNSDIMESIMDEGDIFNYFSDPKTHEHGHGTMEKAKRSANNFFRGY
jgi:metal-dependent hydrolase (beta-lactamase superfamily II)